MDYFVYLRHIRESSLSSKARIVALIIASYNPSYPTNQQIADGSGLSERTVRNAKAELVSKGYLRQTRTFNAANHYQPTAPAAAEGGTTLPPKYKLNTNINTKEIEKDSKESLESINQLNQEEVQSIFEIEKEMTPAAARIIEEDWLSW